MTLKLVVRSKATCEPDELILSEDSYGIGRMHDNALSIQHDGISGYHAELTQTPEGDFLIKDLQSTNGTFLNGEEVSHPTPVKSGDTLHFGNVEVAVEPNAISTFASESNPEESSLTLVSLKEHLPFEEDGSNNTYPISPVRTPQPMRNPALTPQPSMEAEALAPESGTAIEGIEIAREDENTEAIEREKEAEQARQIEREKEVERERQIEREKEIERARQIELEKEAERARQIERKKEAEQARQIEREKEAEQARQIEREKEIEQARQIEREKEIEPVHEAEKVTVSQLQQQIAEFKLAFEQFETTKQTLMQSNLELKQQVEAAKSAIQRSAETEAKLRQNYAAVVEKWRRAESRTPTPAAPVQEASSRSSESGKPVLMRRSASEDPERTPNHHGRSSSHAIHQNGRGPQQMSSKVDPTPSLTEKNDRDLGMSS